jgi:hypothetical protein
MRLFRYACAGLATSVLAASAFTAPAAAQTAGVGTSLTSTKVLTAQLGAAGSVLDLALLVDEARSTIDSAVASPEAYTRLTALAAKASIVPTSPVNVTEGVFEAKSSGPSEVAIAGSTLAVPASVPAPLSPVLSGTVDPGKLTATLNQGVAASTMSSSVSSVKAIGGLVGVGSVKSVLDASSGPSSSSGSRGASATDLTVLDLGALLNGLGLPLGELTPAQLIALVDSLGVAGTLGLPTGSDTLAEAVATLNAAIDDLQATIATAPGATSDITDAIDDTTETLLGTVGGLTGVTVPLPSLTQTVDEAIATVNALIDELQVLIADLLADGLAALDGLALLRLEGVEVGVATKAVDTVAGSVATVTGKIGKVHVGGVELAGIDLAGTAEQLTAALAAINTQLGQVLAIVDPGLANLVKVSVLDKATSITQEGGYTKSRAGITAATATITPPANLATIVSGLIATADDVTAQLAAAGVAVPQLDGLMNQLAGTLNLASSALTAPASVRVASVLSASDYRLAAPVAPSAPGSTPTLPRTGGPDLVLFAGLLGVLALAIRRFTHAPEVKAVEVRR